MIEKDKEKDKQIESLTEQVKNIDVIIGQRFSELFSKYGLVDYNNNNNNNNLKNNNNEIKNKNKRNKQK